MGQCTKYEEKTDKAGDETPSNKFKKSLKGKEALDYIHQDGKDY